MIPSIGGPELIILLVIVLLLFGAKRIPELAKGLGSGMREFKKSSSGQYDEVEEGEKADKKKNEDEEVLDRENEKAQARPQKKDAGTESAATDKEKAEQEQRS
ncbi:MAG: twin-arginine translocase TatA/TatE family subunit [Rubrobacteraceae bacterium]